MRNRSSLSWIIWICITACNVGACTQIIGIQDLPKIDGGGDAGGEMVDASEGCGNGTQEFGEACDDGAETARCNADCSLAECGDGKLNRTAGETCDDDNVQSGDGCDAECQLECGNGQFDESEACDEGGLNTATCDLDCTVPECNDGVFNELAEVCESNGVNSETCNANCTLISCGDGFFNPAADESCDTAGASAACDADCTLPLCGDGVVNPAREVCDLGGVNVAGCDFDCTVPLCGDGVLNREANEQCDDGNASNSDGCGNTCRLPTGTGPGACGNGVVDRFEQCDDGDGDDDDECTADCTFGPVVTCGNGVLEAREACEPVVPGQSNQNCDADCTTVRCGDGFINRAAGEQCDDGNSLDGDFCSATCQLLNCGDGVKNSFEQCDDGNRDAGDGCSPYCQIECGNGVIDANEQCDEGDRIPGDGCSPDCRDE